MLHMMVLLRSVLRSHAVPAMHGTNESCCFEKAVGTEAEAEAPWSLASLCSGFVIRFTQRRLIASLTFCLAKLPIEEFLRILLFLFYFHHFFQENEFKRNHVIIGGKNKKSQKDSTKRERKKCLRNETLSYFSNW